MAASFSPDGKRIVTASHDKTARVWDADNGQPITPPLRHDGGVEHAAFSSDGRWVVTASWDWTVRLWSTVTGDPITPAIWLGEGGRDARLSADGQRLVTASGSAAQVRSLAREARPVGDLILLTQLLTGQATDARGRRVPLKPEAVKKAWQTLRAKPAQPPAGSLPTALAWHRQALSQALRQQEGFAARFHLDRLLELMPGDESLRGLRAGMEAGSAASGGLVSDEFAERRSRVPPQDTGAPENLIDLSDYYNRPLSEGHTWWMEWRNLLKSPSGCSNLGRREVRFARVCGVGRHPNGLARTHRGN